MSFGRSQGQRVHPERPSAAVPAPSQSRPSPPLQAGGLTDESEINFDPTDGHNHDGSGSAPVDHDSLTNVSEDQHHDKQHNLWDSAHHGDVTGTPANGDIPYRDTTWKRLPKSTNGFFLWLASGLPAWVQLAFSHITGAITDAQHGALTTSSTHGLGGDASGTTAAVTVDKIKGVTAPTPVSGDDEKLFVYDHGTTAWVLRALAGDVSGGAAAVSVDKVKGKSVTTPVDPTHTGQYLKFDGTGLTWDDPPGDGGTGSDGSDHNLFDHADTTGTPAEGDLIYRNGSSQWARRAIGSAGAFLRVVAGLPAWASAAFSDLTGAITDAQHGALTTSSTHGLGGDASGTTAAVAVNKGKGITFPAPGAGDNAKVLQYDHGGTQYVLASVNSLATSIAIIQAWRRSQIQNAATSKGEMPQLDGVASGLSMLRSGRIVGVVLDVEADMSNTVTDWFEVEVYKRTPSASMTWAATGVSARLMATAGAADVNASGTGSVSFSALDQLTIYDQRNGMGSSVLGVKATVYLVFD